MTQRRTIGAVAAAAALTVAGMGASYATPTAVNRAGGSISENPPLGGPQQSLPTEGFRVYQRPTVTYTGNSCVIDLSKYEELSGHRKVRGCGTAVRFSTEFTRASVPQTWGPWSCPPDSESCTPDVMSSNEGIVAATVDFGETVTTGGFEYSPSNGQVERIRVAFFTGPHGSGTLVGSITRDVDGNGGARLFGATAKAGFRSAVLTNNADDDFAIAQIRV